MTKVVIRQFTVGTTNEMIRPFTRNRFLGPSTPLANYIVVQYNSICSVTLWQNLLLLIADIVCKRPYTDVGLRKVIVVLMKKRIDDNDDDTKFMQGEQTIKTKTKTKNKGKYEQR